MARLFLKDSKLLILDEPTAALDTENQKLVQDAIFDLIGPNSAIIVAHRLSTLGQADRIVVLNNGIIAQTGTYENLANSPGIFRTLVEKEQIEMSNTRHD